MKVLVACEFSGIVRDAFIKKGHDAWSCDLEPSERPGNHVITDVRNILNDGWDMMLAFPPCTHLAVSGARWFHGKLKEQEDALEFVRTLLDAPIYYIALENPKSIISSRIRPPDHCVQPWQFGHPHAKMTCLWLKNLPKLQPTNILPSPPSGHWENQTKKRTPNLGQQKNRSKIKSRTYEGIASAMADQWGAML